MRRRLILLDRDGTVILDKHYLSDPDEVELIPGAAEAIRRLNEAGHAVVIVSNQSGVARGMFSMDEVDMCNRWIEGLLEKYGARVDRIYTCPDLDEDAPCRKPNTGMLEQAARDFDLPLSEAVMIGDKPADIEAGRRVGARTVLVRTGEGRETERRNGFTSDFAGDDLNVAVDWILTHPNA